MKMYCGRLLTMLVVGCGWLMAGAAPAMAQDLRTMARGHFTLPYEVHWKSSVLPPGDYTFELRGNSAWMTVALHGPGGDTRVSGPTLDSEQTRESSKLMIGHRDGVDYVQDLYLTDVGLHLRYEIPKPSKSERLLAKRQASQDSVTVAVR